MKSLSKLLAKNLIGQKLSNHAKSALIQAAFLAQELKEKEIGQIHLLYTVYQEKGSLGTNILKDMGIEKKFFPITFLEVKEEKKKKVFEKNNILSEDLKKTITKAYSIAKRLGYSYVGTEHLVYALLNSKDKTIREILMKTTKKTAPKGLPSKNIPFSPENFSNKFSDREAESPFSDILVDTPGADIFLTHLQEMIAANRKKQSIPSETAWIENFCTDINKEISRNQETIIGREKEISRIIGILGRKTKSNPLLIGQPGVGKTALISRLAQLINSQKVPAYLADKVIMNLNVANLIAGTSFRGEFESRLKNILQDIKKNGNIILFIDEIHNIIGAGNIAGSLDLANILKPALSRGEIQLIGATTMTEYKKYLEKDSALERRFQPIIIKEPELEEARKILHGVKKDYETFHNVFISSEAVDLAVELSNRYIRDRYLPDKAIDVLDETAATVRSRQLINDFTREINQIKSKLQELAEKKERLVAQERYEKAIELRNEEKKLEEKFQELKKKQKKVEHNNCIIVTDNNVIETMSKISRISKEKLAREKNYRIRNINQLLSGKIIGQDDIIEKISNILIRSQFGISNPDRPLGSFLFLGPTGVGKTLTARVLAKEFFGQDGSFIKIDMSEFLERHSLAALIGSPAGYVGYGEGGRLTEKVRNNPYSVVLFDEIEKAHPDIHNILLQILEDGVLTDAQGLEVSFRNTVIILTSNIEISEYTDFPPIGFSSSPEKKNSNNSALAEATGEIEKILRPELVSRLDHILVFNVLKEKNLDKIAALEMEKLQKRLLQNKLCLELESNVTPYLAKKSLRQNQGARPIRRIIQEAIENPIARMIMEDKIKENKIKITIAKDKVILK